ncbi:MAG: imidazolonepropionase [Bacteroidales bacterium]|jgi:imidazolonepropionase|nr:imidazolonepropionase [Bacteroidales bacterium]
MALVIKNIKELIQVEEPVVLYRAGKDMKTMYTIKDAWLKIENDFIADFGEMHTFSPQTTDTVIDADGGMVFPSFCDSHTHLVYKGSREIEYIDKIKGLSYEEIAKRGGGILNTAKRIHEASEDDLFAEAWLRMEEIKRYGTGAVEIKSGYGLTVEDELKMLRVIKLLKEESELTVKTTFLGAHAVPMPYKGRQSEYVDLIINEMIPEIGKEKLADFIDVFCDKGFFTVEETDRILTAGAKYGLVPKIHANELDYSGGIQVGVKHKALSVDHLEYTGDDEIKTLLASATMPTLLPGAAFFLGMVYAPARKMIDAGLPLAMASDFNPGSSPSGNMQFILSMGCIKYKLLPEEAINAVTINSAYAMGCSKTHGSIARNKKANLFITTPIPTYEFMPYAYGSNKVKTVILNGKIQS